MRERNLGVDLLRILSMLFILIAHMFYRGGIFENITAESSNYEIAWLMETAAFCSVNIYGLISGYVGVNANFRFYRIISLWMQVVFYTLMITVIFNFIYPEAIAPIRWINAILPVSRTQYWYFTAYFGMFFFIPFLNKALNNSSRKELMVLATLLVGIFSVYQTCLPREIFNTDGGASMLWLSVLYLLGGIIKKTEQTNEQGVKLKWLFVFFVGVIFTWAWKYFLQMTPLDNMYAEKLNKFIAPTILLNAVTLLLFFKSLSIGSKLLIRLIKYLAPLAFSVYIIHANPLIWDFVFAGRFASFAEFSPLKLFVAVIFAGLIIFGICTTIDAIRLFLFKKMRIDDFSKRIEKVGQTMFEFFVGKK